MQIRFWGVRGSIPCPGPATVKYGGNTAAIEIRVDNGRRLVIIDAGSGIRELGNAVASQGPIQADLFLTHTHWDHILGFPFFTPIYIPGTRLTVYGPATFESHSLKEIVGGQLTYRYFPVREAELAAKINYVSLKEETRDLGDGLTVTTKYLNHPILCLGYRFACQGKVFCTAFDTEPYRSLFSDGGPDVDPAMAAEGEVVAQEENQRMGEFIQGADLVVYDAQYTQAEYDTGKIGWGHTPIEQAARMADQHGIKRLALFHHDPMRTDDQLDALAAQYCDGDRVFFAREGMIIDL